MVYDNFPKRHFGRIFIDALSDRDLKKELEDAFAYAIERYIISRQEWLNDSIGRFTIFGLRSQFQGMKLFYNKSKTKKNIQIMRQIQQHLYDKDLSPKEVRQKVLNLRSGLTSNGRARELVDVFLNLTAPGPPQILPVTGARPESIVFYNGEMYTQDVELGSGVFGRAQLWSSKAGGMFVVKTQHTYDEMMTKVLPEMRALPLDEQEEAAREILDQELRKANPPIVEKEIFEWVFQNIGMNYPRSRSGAGLGRAELHQRADFFQHIPSSVEAEEQIISPFIRGVQLKKFAQNNKHYNEVDMTMSCFDFLYHLNICGVAHGDAHEENFLVLDDFQTVFLIDYGKAILLEDRTNFKANWNYETWRKLAIEDISLVISSMFYLRKLAGLDPQDENFSQLYLRYNLKRFIGPVFVDPHDMFESLLLIVPRLVDIHNTKDTIIFDHSYFKRVLEFERKQTQRESELGLKKLR